MVTGMGGLMWARARRDRAVGSDLLHAPGRVPAVRMFTPETVGSRVPPFAFAAIAAAISVYLGDAAPRGPAALWGSILTAVVVTLPFVLVRLQLPASVDLVVPMAYFVVVALLREAQGGSGSGLSVLVLLPVVWLALYGTAWQLVLAGIAAVLTLVLPIVLLGAPEYPTAEWRRAIATAMVATIVGFSVQRLVVTVRDQSRTDPLTGLPNRRALDERLALELASARRRERPLSVLFIDLDHFKAVNDREGHARGDRLITESGSAWRRALRAPDFLARIGGEEFIALLPECGPHQAQEIAERLRLATPGGMTSSAGLVAWDGREEPDVLLQRADQALFAAKAAGRNRVVVGQAGPA
jgi:diguanylate cyclase (GGDEF)-like protein